MFFSRPKTRTTVHAKSQRVGLDLTASRIRAVVSGPTERPVLLDSPDVELRLSLALDRKPIGVGRCGFTHAKKSPHLVGANFLAAIGSDLSWKIGRQIITADGAIGLTMGQVSAMLASEAEAISLALPSYLTVPQSAAISMAATVNRLPIVGTITTALAVVQDRADAILLGIAALDSDDDRPSDIVPIRVTADGPGSAVVIDADDHALSASVVWVDRDVVRVLGSAVWPKLASRLWVDRLIDTISDRCVRLCRRDPRDSAEAEQSLFEQIDRHLDGLSPNRPMSFHLRAAHWVQDLVQQSSDFDSACSAFVSQSITNLTDLIYASGVPAPPRAIWLTAAAARLPGLRSAVYDHSAESTDVTSLPADAIASAVARLTPRWLAGELPRQHLDSVFPLTRPATHRALESSRLGSAS